MPALLSEKVAVGMLPSVTLSPEKTPVKTAPLVITVAPVVPSYTLLCAAIPVTDVMTAGEIVSVPTPTVGKSYRFAACPVRTMPMPE